MTEPPTDIGAAVLEELRGLREAVERGINSAQDAAADVTRVEVTSNRRARTFRRLWVGLATALAIFIGVSTAGFVVNEQHRADDDERRACFQDWANRTAERTQTLATASDMRISALNEVLAIRTRTDRGDELHRALVRAAAAGAAYERTARENPPVPPSTLTCAD